MTPTTASLIATARVFPVIPAEDLDRARRFYRDTLGFDIDDQPDLSQFTIHAGDGTQLLVYERARTKAEHTAAGFIVDDLDAVMADMRSRGVEFEEYDLPGLKTVNGVAEMDGIRSAWFTDPEGNIISVGTMP